METLLDLEKELRPSLTEDALPAAVPLRNSAIPLPAPVAPGAPEPAFAPQPEIVLSPLTPAVPSKKRQSWGALLSIIVIVLMVIIGAFYTWGQRIAQQQGFPAGLQQ